jgi:hypothetical protein
MKNRITFILIALIIVALSVLGTYSWLKQTAQLKSAEDAERIAAMKKLEDSYKTNFDCENTYNIIDFNAFLNNLLAAPITRQFADTLRAHGRKFIAHKTPMRNLIFVEPEIKVVDLITFIDTKKNNPMKFGFQLYSVLIDKKLAYVISVCHESDSSLENKYTLLDKVDYRTTDSITRLDTIDKKQTILFIKNYVNYVTIEGGSQKDSTYKVGRFYPFKEFKLYLQNNGFYDLNQRDMDEAYVSFVHGYINKQSDRFIIDCFTDEIFTGAKYNDYKGWTSIMELHIKGKPVSNSNKAEDYKGALIEIGKPCPPRCDGTKIKGKDIWEVK